MSRLRPWIASMASLLAACAMQEPVVTPPPSPPPPKAVVMVVPPSSEDSLPSERVVLNLPKSGATAKPNAGAGKPVKPGPEDKSAPAAQSEPAPVPTPPKPAAKAKAEPASINKFLNEFPWLQYCAKRVEFSGAVQCDADTLLTPPSARVQVYVREPKLVRTTPEGSRIQLRESLPKLYRFFVLP